MPSINGLHLMRVESIHRAAAIPRKKVKKVAMVDDFRDIHNGDKSNSIFHKIVGAGFTNNLRLAQIIS